MGLFSKDDKKLSENRPPAPLPSDQGASGAPSDAPPSYDQLQQIHTGNDETPQYNDNNYGPSDYPPEKQTGPNGYPIDKKGDGFEQPPPQQGQYFQAPPPPQNQGSGWEAPGWGGAPQQPQGYQQGNASMPPNAYVIPPRTVNIATDNGQYTRPEYQQYKARDQQRMAHGDFPKPREAFKHGAPLEPSNKSQGKSSGGFPGSSGSSYYNAANR
ncbi:hypothetical protein C7M61_001520 [Candidozyma pseudohaemuli]|uniref:Uncharacterized protein n=1 Tax=Candidozyma pseudohaemuli TaxID=418784 RepID=A0A2P7YUT2_9ASCO|nr:hypothetical protein C7M61_001520 [[Candida] pseudohaemulonii]PSK39715.1 hypothetical protein C7M61_001520 [[Candida] pseudohaemulonii]